MRHWLISAIPLALALAAQALPKGEERARFHSKVAAPEPSAGKAHAQRRKLLSESPLAALPFRCVGPMGQGGRVVALAVDARRPSTFLAAFATGGLWITEDEGASWRSLFDHESAFAIGHVAVRWGAPGVPAEIWVGTGEANASRSSYGGDGVFKSTDGGRTWKHLGLSASFRVARVVLHPSDPKVAWVAAQGPLYTEGGQRGVFMTSDGGASWTQALATPERTGACDLVLDPRDPQVLYAATWEKDRKPWNFLEAGPGSGVHKSTDGGRTWTRLAGFPASDTLGRTGLAVARDGRVFAFLDQHATRPGWKDPFEDPEALTPRRLRGMDKAALLKVEEKILAAFLKDHGFPKSLTAAQVRKDLEAGTLQVKDLLDWMGDANAALFDTDIVGQELWASSDGGATWARTHERPLDQVGHTYGYYFGQVVADPADSKRVFVGGVPLLESRDGGRTFRGINGTPEGTIHPDHHALWVDPSDPRRMISGHDGGLDLSTDGGRSWRGLKNLPVGQFYTIHADDAEPFQVYGGLQDNGVRRGPSRSLRPGQQTDGWATLHGGDGGFIQVDPRDRAVFYTESQFGWMERYDAKGSHDIRPRHALKEAPHRFNWMSPILLSPHSPEILYTGSQRVLRSLDRGETWTTLSGDLTTSRPQGDVPFGTITVLAESPKRFGLLYAGTDDGRVWITRDGGFSWKEAAGLPKLWVTRLEPSRFDEGTVYATLSAYRNDRREAHLYRSTDFGATWKSLKGNLPEENLNVIREDSARKDLLYAGSDAGVYASLDGGATWTALGHDMPNVPVHDIFVQAKAPALVVGTHGRSAWVAPLAPLQALTEELRRKPLALLPVASFKAKKAWKQDRPSWFAREDEEPKSFYIHLAAPGSLRLELKDAKGDLARAWTLEGRPGLNRVDWDLLVDPARLPGLPEGRRPFVRPGTYTLVAVQGEARGETEVKVDSEE